MQIHELTALARQMKASDIHISQGLPLMFRIDGVLREAPVQYDADTTRALIESMLDEAHREALDLHRLDADFAIAAPDGTRSRVNVFYQQGKLSATLRLLNDEIPTMEQLGLPPVLKKLADEPRGLILVTGPTGSGKSTTLASMIDYINQNRSDHILTIEDPIEYVYKSKKALIHQREVGSDVTGFAARPAQCPARGPGRDSRWRDARLRDHLRRRDRRRDRPSGDEHTAHHRRSADH